MAANPNTVRAPADAVSKVFSIPEIFDRIITQLDERIIITCAQRVCRTWKDFISASPAIQTALFYQPSKGRNGDPERVRNPILAKLFPAWFNPVGHGYQNIYPPSRDAFCDQPFYKANIPTGTDAPWRKMLIQNSPPIKTVGMLWHTSDAEGNLWINAKLFTCTDGAGLRMGQYYDIAELQKNNDNGRPIVYMAEGIRTLEFYRSDWHDKSSVYQSRIMAAESMREYCILRDHPRREEVERQKRKIMDESDICFLTPFKDLSWSRFPGGEPERGSKEWYNGPPRDNFMKTFLDDDAAVENEKRFGLRQVYSWSARIDNGYDQRSWGRSMMFHAFD